MIVLAYLRRGLTYGSFTLLVAFMMGAVYGIFNLAPIQPAFAFATFLGLIVFLNFLFAIPLWIGWFLVFIFIRRKFVIPKYFFISLGFSLIFLAFFALMKFGNLYFY